MADVSQAITDMESKMTKIEQTIVENKLTAEKAVNEAKMAKDTAQAAKDVCTFAHYAICLKEFENKTYFLQLCRKLIGDRSILLLPLRRLIERKVKLIGCVI